MNSPDFKNIRRPGCASGALICLNLRREWIEDERAIASSLERQMWCVDRARQTGWSVFHMHEAHARRARCTERGALRGLTPLRSEPVYSAPPGLALAHEPLRNGLRSSAVRRLFIIGFLTCSSLMVTPRSSEWTLTLVHDAVVDVFDAAPSHWRDDDTLLVESSRNVFQKLDAQIIDLKAWRARSGTGA